MKRFEDTCHYREIILRGIHISMTADVEWTLTMILSSIFTGREQELYDMYGKPLNRLKLHEKIGAVQLGLIRYHASFFINHREDFKLLHNLRTIRNKFGHGKIDWVDETNKEDLFITEMTNSGLDKKPYKNSILFKDLEEYRKSVMNFLDMIKLLFLNTQ